MPPGRAAPDPPAVAVLVPAAGAGERMGGVRKPFIELEGSPVLSWALAPFLARRDVVEVVVALADVAGEEGGLPFDRRGRVRAVTGGASRFESVKAALAAVRSGAALIAVHDAARPLPPAEAIAQCIRVASGGAGAVAGAPAVDTIKRAGADGTVVETPPRAAMWQAQTPQVFPRALFERAVRAHDRRVARARADGAAPPSPPTDDASLLERIGAPVRMVKSCPTNIKITRPEDLAAVEGLIAAEMA